MAEIKTQMRREILQIPEAAANLLDRGGTDIRQAAKAIKARDPQFMISVARGSSDHVASYLKYGAELLLGTPIASIGPSIASIYKQRLRLNGSVCLTVSQSGQSPDIVNMAQMAGQGGALSLALTNQPDSPLANVSDYTLALYAGEEISVAATKTFINSAITGMWLLAECADDKHLLRAIYDLPDVLEKAVKINWPDLRAALDGRNSIFCLGRGPAYAMSNEAALKFKETCQIHAESYSSAEVMHGPISIVDKGFPVIGFASNDPAEAVICEVADDIAIKGGRVFVTSDMVRKANSLSAARTDHALTDPIALIASFYSMVEKVATTRGINPDAPRHLKKVTETV